LTYDTIQAVSTYRYEIGKYDHWTIYTQVFAKQQWNEKNQSYFESTDPEALKNNFTDKIGSTNSLKLTKIYILTTKSSASASELVINGFHIWM
jgi:hypothetical protein